MVQPTRLENISCHLEDTIISKYQDECRYFNIKKARELLTLKGLGTRIDLVAYIALKPRASPSNIEGPILLFHSYKRKLNFPSYYASCPHQIESICKKKLPSTSKGYIVVQYAQCLNE